MAGYAQIKSAHRTYVDISERAMGLLAHVFATRPAEPVHAMLQLLRAQQQQQQQQQQADCDIAERLYAARRAHREAQRLVQSARGALAQAHKDRKFAEAAAQRACAAAGRKHREKLCDFWRQRGVGAVVVRADARQAARKQRQTMFVAALPSHPGVRALAGIVCAVGRLCMGRAEEGLYEASVSGGRVAREAAFRQRIARAGAGEARNSGGRSDGSGANAGSKEKQKQKENQRRVQAAFNYYEILNVGVPSDACAASPGAALTAAGTQARHLVEVAANVADMCCDSAVEGLMDQSCMGGARRRESIFRRRTMMRAQPMPVPQPNESSQDGPAAEARSAPGSVAAAKLVSNSDSGSGGDGGDGDGGSDGGGDGGRGQLAQAHADAKRLHYYDLLNLLPPVRAFNEDDDEDDELLGDYNHKHLLIVSAPEHGPGTTTATAKNMRKFSSLDADW